jgi:hypothetical protein
MAYGTAELAGLREMSGQLNDLLVESRTNIKLRDSLLADATKAEKRVKACEAEAQLLEEVLTVLRAAGGAVAQDLYKHITKSVNAVLREMFPDVRRTIKLTEGTYGDSPQLSIELVTDGVARDISESSGHGVAQVVSLVCTLCLLAISGARRFMILDEVLSGVSETNLPAVSGLLNVFADAGFQFLMVDHRFIPERAKVYELSLNGLDGVVENIYTQVA